jgi:hypothetical protein
MPESSVAFKTRADLRELTKFNAELRALAKNLDEVSRAKARAGAGGPAPGAAPAPEGARPAPPPTPAQPDGAGGGAAATEEGGEAEGVDRTRRRRGGGRKRRRGGGGGGGEAPPTPDPPATPDEAQPPSEDPATPAAQKKPKGATGPTWGDRALSFTKSTASTALGTAVGMGLGQSITGFVMGAGEKYAEISKSLGQLEQRFRSSDGAVAGWGASLGYTIAQVAELDKLIGAVEDKLSVRNARRYAGFSRATGMDAGTGSVLSAMIGRSTGAPLNNAQLSSLTGLGAATGMGQGRFEELLQSVQSLTLAQQQTTGRGNLGTAEGLLGMVSNVFRGSSLGQGAQGLGFLERLQGTMTGNRAFQVMAMRDAGFGSPGGGPGYVEMMKRLEGGVFNGNNLAAMLQGVMGRGLSREQQISTLYNLSGGLGGSLKMHEIEALIDRYGNDAGITQLRGMGNDPDAAVALMRNQPGAIRGDMAALGGRTVTAGERRAVQLEQMQMAVGQPVLEAMSDMTDALVALARSFKDYTGISAATMLTAPVNAMATTARVFAEEGVGGVLERIAVSLEYIRDRVTAWFGGGSATPSSTQSTGQPRTTMRMK